MPLFGDIAISINSIVDKAPHWKSKFDLSYTNEESRLELERSYLLVFQYENMMRNLNGLISNLQLCKSQVCIN